MCKIMEGRMSYSTLKSIISHYLLNVFSELSQQEADFMSDVATQDFINYVSVMNDFLHDSDFSIKALNYISRLADQNPLEIDKILRDWIEVWVLKWKQRVKLVMGDDEANNKAYQELEDKVSPLLSTLGGDLITFRKFAIGSLISSGEVCFTNLMADMIIKEVLFKVASSQNSEEVLRFVKSNPIFIVNEIIKKVKELSRFKGNLVVVRINPAFFQEMQGEAIEWW
ncbi:MAG: hypothetical protein ACP5PL_06915 [Infirmifilum sp.]